MFKNLLLVVALLVLVACSSGQPSPTLPAVTPTQPLSSTPQPTATSTASPILRPTPTPTLTPTSTPVPIESLEQSAAPLCEAAFSKPVTVGEIAGPVFVMTTGGAPGSADSNWEYASAATAQLAFVGARSATNVNAVVCAWETRTRVGQYTDGSAAYRLDWSARLIQWPSGVVVGEAGLKGGGPAFEVDPLDSRAGNAPIHELLKWLVPQLGDKSVFYARSKLGGPAIVALSPDGSRLAVGGAFHLDFWDTTTGDLIRTTSIGYVQDMAWSPDGARLAVAAGRGLLVWSADTAQLLTSIDLPVPTKYELLEAVTGVGWSPDGTKIVSASRQGTLFVWDAQSGEQLQEVVGYEQASVLNDFSSRVAWSPDGKFIALATDKFLVTLWDVESGQQILELSRADNSDAMDFTDNDVAWSPDGEMVAYVTEYAIMIREIERGQQRQALYTRTKLFGVSWSPDGRTIASSSDNVISLWDVETGKELRTLKGYAGPVVSLAWSADSRWLAAGSQDGFVKRWDMTTGE